MPYYEVIYEPGNHALAFYENDEEATQALTAHNERATSGLPGTPSSEPPTPTWPAERIARVLVYENHPADYGVGQQVPAETLTATIEGMADSDGLVMAQEAAAQVRESTSPFVATEGPHDSSYAMEPVRELAWQRTS